MAIVPQFSAASVSDEITPRALHFALTTSPDPVRVSPSVTDPELADFIFVGTRRGFPIQCDKITLTVRTGTSSHQLALDLAGIDPLNSLDWTADIGTGTITLTPPGTEEYTEIAADKGVTIQLMNVKINAEIGSSALDIAVRFRDPSGADPEAWVTDTTTFDIGKFPPDFYVSNFIPDKLSIDSGEGITLSWEVGGATSVHLLYEAADINVLNYVKWPPGTEKLELRSTTVFYLRAGVQAGTSFVERILSATVTVIRPDLELGSLIVHGDTVLKGDTLITPGNTLMADTITAATTYEMVLTVSDTPGQRVTGTPYGGNEWQSLDIAPIEGMIIVGIRRRYPTGGQYLYLTVDGSELVTAQYLFIGRNQGFVITTHRDGWSTIRNFLDNRVLSMTPEGVVTMTPPTQEYTLDQKFSIVPQGDISKGIRAWRTRFAQQVTTAGLVVNGSVAATSFDVTTADTAADAQDSDSPSE